MHKECFRVPISSDSHIIEENVILKSYQQWWDLNPPQDPKIWIMGLLMGSVQTTRSLLDCVWGKWQHLGEGRGRIGNCCPSGIHCWELFQEACESEEIAL